MDVAVHRKLEGEHSILRAYEADGAKDEQGAGRQLKERGVAPNLDVIVREKAHAARGVVKAPGEAIPEIKSHLDRLLLGKGSVLRMLDKSEVLLKYWADAQKESFKHLPKQCRPEIFRNFAFAKQRFDSHSKPLVKYVARPHSVHVALARGATHWGSSPKGKACASAVRDIAASPKFRIHAGCAADAGEAGEQFVRQYDEPMWPKRELVQTLGRFRTLLSELFAKGMVLDDVRGAGAHTQAMLRSMSENTVLILGTTVKILHKVSDLSCAREVVEQWQAWRVLVEAALDAEFPDFEVLQTFLIFNLSRKITSKAAAAGARKFALCFSRVIPDADAFVTQWAAARLEALVQKDHIPRCRFLAFCPENTKRGK